MPRTKMPRKKSSIRNKGQSLLRQSSASVDRLASSASSSGNPSDDLVALKTNVYESPVEFLQAFEAYYEKKVDAHVKKYKYCVEYVKDVFSNILRSFPESYLNSTTSSLYNENVLQDLKNNPNIKVSSGRQSRLQASKEESTDFKKPRAPRKDRSSRKRSLSVPAPAAPLPPPEFKTPLNSARQQMAMIKTITPKVSNTPVSVMRRPQHGEVAFSTSGSPLLIGAVSREDIPTVSVPMQDGRVFSILPDPGLPPPDLPDFDEDTKKYLKTLCEHLALLSSP